MMTPISPLDLPLLTDIIDADGTPAEIPTLTEVVHVEPVATPVATSDDTLRHNHEAYSIAHIASELIWNAQPEPSATHTTAPPERNISEAEMQQLLEHFEAHLESVFTDKLNRHLEQLHHQAVKLAILELKSELPELLRKALNTPDLKK